MTNKNVILVTVENNHDGRAMFELIKQIIDGLSDGGALSGDITLLGGISIKDEGVIDALGNLVSALTVKANAEAEKVKSREGNVIEGNFDFHGPDEVLRDLPDLIPGPETVQ
jgi:hypothetical protein